MGGTTLRGQRAEYAWSVVASLRAPLRVHALCLTSDPCARVSTGPRFVSVCVCNLDNTHSSSDTMRCRTRLAYSQTQYARPSCKLSRTPGLRLSATVKACARLLLVMCMPSSMVCHEACRTAQQRVRVLRHQPNNWRTKQTNKSLVKNPPSFHGQNSPKDVTGTGDIYTAPR